jgi:two-component system, NtrC family, response regulator AtoC
LDTTVLEESRNPEARRTAALCLLVMTPNGFVAHPLPQGAALIIGRSSSADIPVSDLRASRRHARLNVGETLTVEDLGSGNGTRLRGTLLEPGSAVPLSVGESLVIGGVCLMVEHADSPGAFTGLWSHSTFDSRAAEACARARVQGGSFGVARIRIDRAALWTDIVPALVQVFRGRHLLSAFGANDYQVLFHDCNPQIGLQLLAEVENALAEIGCNARTGLAWFPRHGRSVDSLVEHAYAETLSAPARPFNDAALPATRSMPVQRLYETAKKAASGNINVLVLGETGVGKEVLAQAIHRLSPRNQSDILCLNCAGLGELLESELFGHERGAFTGAAQAKPGLLETADKGTVFLDEVGELSLAIQAKLLRVIDRREVTRLGGLKPRTIDVRFIAATNRDLEEEVRRGRFRADLLFRLNGISLEIPPLRDRQEDILALCEEFLTEAAGEQGLPTTPRLSAEAIRAIRAYDWPGNVRELRNVMGRAALLASGDEILPEHLPLSKMRARITDASGLAPVHVSPLSLANPDEPASNAAQKPTIGFDERARIVQALATCAGNQSRAARLLGIPRRTFVSKLQSYAIPRPQKP